VLRHALRRPPAAPSWLSTERPDEQLPRAA
jgi:hypothetical protein